MWYHTCVKYGCCCRQYAACMWDVVAVAAFFPAQAHTAKTVDPSIKAARARELETARRDLEAAEAKVAAVPHPARDDRTRTCSFLALSCSRTTAHMWIRAHA